MTSAFLAGASAAPLSRLLLDDHIKWRRVQLTGGAGILLAPSGGLSLLAIGCVSRREGGFLANQVRAPESARRIRGVDSATFGVVRGQLTLRAV